LASTWRGGSLTGSYALPAPTTGVWRWSPIRPAPWFFPAHHELITKYGIFIQQSMDFDTLLADRLWEFAYILTPLQISGATGSISRPMAMG
jgi:hypothetical protein